MQKSISLSEVESQIALIIQEVEESGTSFTINRNGKPVVDLVLHKKSQSSLKQHPKLKGARFIGDPCEQASEQDWPEELR